MSRPRAFDKPEDFEKLANAYFEKCEKNKKPVSWTGLCLAVGLSSRQSLQAYKKGERGKEFVDPTKKALLRVENWYEESCEGAKAIFALKNFGWTDKHEHKEKVQDVTILPAVKPGMSIEEAAKAYAEMVKGSK